MSNQLSNQVTYRLRKWLADGNRESLLSGTAHHNAQHRLDSCSAESKRNGEFSTKFLSFWSRPKLIISIFSCTNFVFNNIFQLYDFEAEFKARREYDEMQSEAATASQVSESVPKQKEPERRQDEFIPAVESTSNQDSATPAPTLSATASSSSSFTTVCHFQITVRRCKFSHPRVFYRETKKTTCSFPLLIRYAISFMRTLTSFRFTSTITIFL